MLEETSLDEQVKICVFILVILTATLSDQKTFI